MTTLILIAIGAALMYFFDPDSGRRRREGLRDRCTSATKKLQGSARTPAPDLSNRTPGVIPEKPPEASDGQLTNEILVNRVQTQMGRAVSQPTAIAVTANQGRVTLSGPVSAEEETALLACVRSVPGVTGVENRLEVATAATTVY